MTRKNRGSANLVIWAILLIFLSFLAYVINFRWKLSWLFLLPVFLLAFGLLVQGLYTLYLNRPAPGEDIPCPNCGHKYHLPAGTDKFQCPLCRKKIVVVTGKTSSKKKAFVAPE